LSRLAAISKNSEHLKGQLNLGNLSGLIEMMIQNFSSSKKTRKGARERKKRLSNANRKRKRSRQSCKLSKRRQQLAKEVKEYLLQSLLQLLHQLPRMSHRLSQHP